MPFLLQARGFFEGGLYKVFVFAIYPLKVVLGH